MPNFRIETWTMPAAKLGGENPLPRLRPRLSATAGVEVDDNVPPADRLHFGYGLDAGWLPHRGLDDYDRDRKEHDFVALTLENEFLRATILPEVGGRLWSLVHRPSGRELLYVNPVFQPANLAVRGAWVAGGVEWNACVYGHSPYNCSSVFAALVEDPRAGTIVRIYEWDRTRCVPYQIDFSLPDGSPVLLVRVRLTNPHARTIPMYWWSNIAVPEAPDVRVVVPAERAYTYEYWGRIHAVDVPVPGGSHGDMTYPTNHTYAGDQFYRIADDQRPWIAALDREGRGLVQTSTAGQIGRKLFAWGMNPGGRRWQEFLSPPGHRYFEIQAGLARTQMECTPMPSSARWEWVEAYGLLEADPAQVHSSDWRRAVGEVSQRLEQLTKRCALEAFLCQSAEAADRPPVEIVHRGSGWGALERIRRSQAGERPFCLPALAFDDESLTGDQAPWLALLKSRTLPEREPDVEPGAWIVQREWQELLQNSLRSSRRDHWLAQLHLGVMLFAAEDTAAAEDAWQRSLKRRPSGWAYRNLAMLRRIEGRLHEALPYYRKALSMLPNSRPLLIEFCDTLLAVGRAAEAATILDNAPAEIGRHSRILTLRARAGLALGLTQNCLPVLNESFELTDIREGETTLTDLWRAYREISDETHAPSIRRQRNDKPHPVILAHLNFQVVADAATESPAQRNFNALRLSRSASSAPQSCSVI